jgi:immune inhibitor A
MKSRIRIIATALVLLTIGYTNGLHAMPPHPDNSESNRGQKSVPMSLADYDHLQNFCRSAGIDSPGSVDLKKASLASDTFKVLAILIDFPDRPAITEASFFDNLIYSGQHGSVRDYFLENSYGKLNIQTLDLPSSTGWLTAPEDVGYYAPPRTYGLYDPYPHNAQKLVEEAVDAADQYVDFSKYDNDHDGYVDGLIIIHSGTGAEFSYPFNQHDIWSHKWSINARQRDGVYIRDYSMMPEYWSEAGDMTCGVYVHELGHVLGLPDLYDTDYSSRGIGKWSVMSTGAWNGYLGDAPAHLDAWSKIELGFAEPRVIGANSNNVRIPAVEDSAVIYKLWTEGKSIANEYFLVENRQRKSYDEGLPGDGLLIWHIDESVLTNDNEWYPSQKDGKGHYMVALEQADNLYELERKASYGNSGDPFPGTSGNTAFTPISEPASLSYDGNNTLVAITDISESSDLMTADFTVSFSSSLDQDEDESDVLPLNYTLEQNYPNPFNGETVISFSLDQPADINITVYNLLGQQVTQLADGRYEPGNHAVHWDGLNAGGHPVSTGVYFYILRTAESSESRKMLLLK